VVLVHQQRTGTNCWCTNKRSGAPTNGVVAQTNGAGAQKMYWCTNRRAGAP